MSRRLTTRLLAASIAVLGLAPAAAHAHTPHATLTTSVATATTYVDGLQDSSGAFVTAGVSNEWAFSALAAAGVAAADVIPAAPNNQTSKNARATYRAYLSPAGWAGGSPLVTDYERATLNAYSAGIDPARVSVTQNLIANIASYWQPTTQGYWGTASNFNGTVFALLALAGATTTAGAQRVPQALLNKSVATVRANQHSDGGWDYPKAEGNPTELASASDIDMTGAAIAALCVSGVATSDSAVVTGKDFLKGKLVPANGAFTSSFGPNTDSNGWGVEGLNACGIPNQGSDFTSATGKTPIDYLVTQQLAGGGFRYTTGVTANAYASIDALRALAGGGFSATPPTPTTAEPKFLASTAFVSGTTSKLALVIDDNSGTLKACSVSVSPATSTTTLGTVLNTATAGSTPASCVTGLATSAGSITSINGVTNGGGTTWKASIDNGTPAGAANTKVVTLGDTIGLKYGS